ncbi:amino acid ABC transporter ATP-binding protein [Salinicola rhizosphaerae]|uniref:ABC transporter n=1 Tax=Salinicola rhizosphaerae TaxID=1443141 RepID=A0ABQ3DVH2_9GAMM|nr:amino acid ABC transporter ATP-binding protein [Salinicola rhizosphaerae]GHB17122.1 ABC transporter [Salinicola rhizosphaerae]
MTSMAQVATPTGEHRSGRPLLELVSISKSFGDNEILKNVTLRVMPQEMVFLIGPSGSGKSTLLRCCNRLETPTSGDILFDNTNIFSPRVDINQIRTKIGMVFQSFNLYPHMTALQNVMLALRKVQGKSKAEAREIGITMLERVGLGERVDHYPSQLSGGQQQRVAIARTLALEPRVVLFDEPTSALDPELVGGVLNTMRELRQAGMTMVVVSHEMRFAQEAADRVVFMADGNIVEENTANELFDNPQHPRTRDFLARISG